MLGVTRLTDSVGTPQMVVDKSGSLAGVKRHDYLPFGEEIGAGVGGRTAGQGFSGSDNVRQKFTSKERDAETGPDYFGARYYASTQGRFTGVDPSKSKLTALGQRKNIIHEATRNKSHEFRVWLTLRVVSWISFLLVSQSCKD
jgi:RHS repeat-associated protein